MPRLRSLSALPHNPSIGKNDTVPKPANMCERATKASTKSVACIAPHPPVPTREVKRRTTNKTSLRDPCAACGKLVSPKVQVVTCLSCKLGVHTSCDATLTPTSIDQILSDTHPAIHYLCAKCRLDDNTTSLKKLEDRVRVLEELLNKILKDQPPTILHNYETKTIASSSGTYPPLPRERTPQSENDQPVVITATQNTENVRSVVITATKKGNTAQSNPQKCVAKIRHDLSVICTNVTELNDTLLQRRHNHDKDEWEKLCCRMKLNPIEPVTITRLARSLDSPNRDKPKLLKVTVATEKELEDILLSAYLLKDATENNQRVFADVPWWERTLKARNAGVDRSKHRNLILLGVPEAEDPSKQKQHDSLQWKFISDTLSLKNTAVVDVFRIPKSPKYIGVGPRPLKLTFLRDDMLEETRIQWQENHKLLPKYLRMTDSIRTGTQLVSDTPSSITIKSNSTLLSKNDQVPALCESAV